MTHRGPFQPLLFCDSVSVLKMIIHARQSKQKPTRKCMGMRKRNSPRSKRHRPALPPQQTRQSCCCSSQSHRRIKSGEIAQLLIESKRA